jgi:2-C-methyl-D-erythritol 2,4-cyclodiphosphate synthase
VAWRAILEPASLCYDRAMLNARVGIGYDVHRLVEGRPLILGGVRIEFERGLQGHSDADALSHAVIDALLGAAALGDIGQHFPDTDERWRGADSMALLEHARALLAERGYRVVNVDTIVVAEAPRMKPHVPAMRERLARALAVEVDCVSVKATTEEGLGPVGRREAIAARAVALIERIAGGEANG